jgi:hypothetical protein
MASGKERDHIKAFKFCRGNESKSQSFMHLLEKLIFGILHKTVAF